MLLFFRLPLGKKEYEEVFQVKRLFAVLIVVCTACVLLPLAASAAPAIVLGSDRIAPGNTVWFGKTNGPLQWQVLSGGNDSTLETSKTGEALLISKEILDIIVFNPDGGGNLWSNSVARTWCKNFTNKWIIGTPERVAINHTMTSESGSYPGKWNDYYVFGPASLDDDFFFLSAKEADTYFATEEERGMRYNGEQKLWWLRSPYQYYGADEFLAGGIMFYGEAVLCDIHNDQGARPAFNLDLAKVLFVSAAQGGKNVQNGAVEKISAGSSSDWKLTLADSFRFFSSPVGPIEATAGEKISVPYENAQTGSNEYISVLVLDGTNALYYGSVRTGASGGTAEFALPADMPAGNYTLMVFNEQKNADRFSDAASAFVETELRVEAAAAMAYSDATGSYAIENGEAEYQKPAKAGSSVKVPDTVAVNGQSVPVTRIADNAFKGQKKMTKVTLGANIREIGKNAFANCAKLKTVSGGANLEVIGDSAFSGCKVLKSVTIGAKVNKIGKKAFYKCAALKKVTIKSVLLTKSTVGSAAFKGINAKATIKVPKSVKKEYTKWLLKKGVKKTMKIK